jgi:hypothetical protein
VAALYIVFRKQQMLQSCNNLKILPSIAKELCEQTNPMTFQNTLIFTKWFYFSSSALFNCQQFQDNFLIPYLDINLQFHWNISSIIQDIFHSICFCLFNPFFYKFRNCFFVFLALVSHISFSSGF